jgi:putative oxidoreductase
MHATILRDNRMKLNFRNRKLVIAVRVLLGLFLIMSGVTGFMAAPEMQGIPAPMVETQRQLWNMGIFQMIKLTEIIAGIMLVAGFLPWLAAIFFAPVAVGIVVYNSRISPDAIPMGILMVVLTAFLGYVYWDKYKALFKRAQ